MKLRGTLCAFAALLLWANASQACGSTHEPDLRLDIVQQHDQAEITTSALAVGAELTAAANESAEFAFSKWMLLLDHEGESFAVVRTAAMADSDELPDQYAGIEADAPSASVEIDVPVRRFLVEDEDLAAAWPSDEQADAETTASTSTEVDEPEMALDRFEDR
jgi:hypothetical protein